MPDASPPPPRRWTGRAGTALALAGFVAGAFLLVAGAATGYTQHCAPPGCTQSENCSTPSSCLNSPTPIGLATEIAGAVCVGGSVLFALAAAFARCWR